MKKTRSAIITENTITTVKAMVRIAITTVTAAIDIQEMTMADGMRPLRVRLVSLRIGRFIRDEG